MWSNKFRDVVMTTVMAIAGTIVLVMVIRSFVPSVSEAFIIEIEYTAVSSDVSSERSAARETVVSSETNVININTATRRELQKLNGIGEVTARAIIDYRSEHGDFLSVDELLNVKGIGEKTLEKLRGMITV